MENKNIIVRITDILDNAIKYFEESYKLGEERFYTIKDGVDSETAKKIIHWNALLHLLYLGKILLGINILLRKFIWVWVK